MDTLDDVVEAAERVQERCPDLPREALVRAAIGALEIAPRPDLEIAIERIAREFAALDERAARR